MTNRCRTARCSPPAPSAAWAGPHTLCHPCVHMCACVHVCVYVYVCVYLHICVHHTRACVRVCSFGSFHFKRETTEKRQKERDRHERHKRERGHQQLWVPLLRHAHGLARLHPQHGAPPLPPVGAPPAGGRALVPPTVHPLVREARLQPALPLKGACVRVRACVCVRACVRACGTSSTGVVPLHMLRSTVILSLSMHVISRRCVPPPHSAEHSPWGGCVCVYVCVCVCVCAACVSEVESC